MRSTGKVYVLEDGKTICETRVEKIGEDLVCWNVNQVDSITV